MQSSQTPTLMPLPFASGGGKNTIPEASQLPANPGGASFTDGFPPATRTPIVAGGIPPAGLDMNGILFAITQITRWSNAGGLYTFNSSFASDVNVGGYPAGAELMSADLQGSWISINDNNTDNPDTGPGTKWIPGRAYGVTAISGLTNANVTLTPAQAAKNKITLAGTLTGNIQIIVPAWTREWSFVNNTSGSFSITVKTASGTGITLPAGQTKLTCDGTNVTQPAESVATATIATNPVQFGQVSGVVGTVRNLKMSVAAASASATMTADEIVVESALGGLRYCLASFNKTINLGTVGAGGMDVGTAPVSGYVALYAIYNPTTSTAALLATNATSAVAPHVYGGANMPSGYTASALVSVWPTNGSSQFVQAVQRDRRISLVSAGGFTTATTAASWTSIAIGGIPQNAVRVSGNISSLTSVASVTQLFQVASDANGAGAKSNVSTTVVASNGTSMPFDLDIYTAQTAWYKASNPSGTPSFSMIVAAYDI